MEKLTKERLRICRPSGSGELLKSSENADIWYELICEVTNKFRTLIEPPKNEEPKRYSKKAAKMIAHLSAMDGGSMTIALSEIISELIDEDISHVFKKIKPGARGIPPRWTCVVPLCNTNSHNYQIGEAIVVDMSDVCMRQNFWIGNHMDFQISSYRIATDKEIKDFVSKLAKSKDVKWG